MSAGRRITCGKLRNDEHRHGPQYLLAAYRFTHGIILTLKKWVKRKRRYGFGDNYLRLPPPGGRCPGAAASAAAAGRTALAGGTRGITAVVNTGKGAPFRARGRLICIGARRLWTGRSSGAGARLCRSTGAFPCLAVVVPHWPERPCSDEPEAYWSKHRYWDEAVATERLRWNYSCCPCRAGRDRLHVPASPAEERALPYFWAVA